MLRTCWAFCLLGYAGVAAAQLSPGNPLSGLERLKTFESQRASSSDPDWKNGNNDSRPIKPGGTLTLAELQGPGMIAHFWCTIAHPAAHYSRLMTLRIYWDGEEHPSVECPIGDFFGIGHGVDRQLASLPIRVTSLGRGRNCYWPMPFRKSARITVTNESELPCYGIFYYIDWQKHPSLPADTAYFHAMYRQEFPCVMGRNYLLADIVGRGHYVGTVQSVVSVSTAGTARETISSSLTASVNRDCAERAPKTISATAGASTRRRAPITASPMSDYGKAGDLTPFIVSISPIPSPSRNRCASRSNIKGHKLFPMAAAAASSNATT